MSGYMKRVLVVIAWVCFFGSIVAWPATALTIAKEEPQVVLGISFIALVLTSLDIVINANVNKEMEAANSCPECEHCKSDESSDDE